MSVIPEAHVVTRQPALLHLLRSNWKEILIIGYILATALFIDTLAAGSYLLLEFGWQITFWMTIATYTRIGSMVLAIKRYGLDLDRAAHVAAPNKSAAWFWFIANRVIGTLQPTVSLAVMLFVSQVPIQSAWIGYLVLIIDLPMTWWGFVVFKNRFFPHIGS